ncbi:hypothetical protein NDQ72_09820 [Halomonas sp. KG2]|uniref:hypothetical protein n=1 Tax=Halomonas sp. KG2 TaxID=2951138 RepID=UPI002647A057|nr:hypothetical protein [Halomonas sp. KG2]WKD30215.1 hypothetical protein NDQ72_09820 [Halomonas sp. KG2]
MDEVFGKNAILLLGAMFAALIAGYFAFTNLVASKENKVSEFRQDWINSLRNSVARYISSLTYLSTLYIHYSARPEEKRDKFEMARDVEEIYAKVNESYNDIIFRINDREKRKKGKELNDAFLDALYKTRKHYQKNELAEARSACEPLREASKPLLKYEWKRVKAGELNYRISKYFAIFVLVCGLIAAFVNASYILGAGNESTTTAEAKPNQSMQLTADVSVD